ncbi:hypothetical protein ACFWYW_04725 [Nonomuraea sp. NPDC059023]|uniref:hypothetical protein n=1 Tax=Nonomuraea sp. NPDC059023 TaxID=3346706 RepID=UPI0036CF9900
MADRRQHVKGHYRRRPGGGRTWVRPHLRMGRVAGASVGVFALLLGIWLAAGAMGSGAEPVPPSPLPASEPPPPAPPTEPPPPEPPPEPPAESPPPDPPTGG